MSETWVQSLGQEDLLKKEITTHSSSLVWEILSTEEPGGLQSRGLQESDMTSQHNNKVCMQQCSSLNSLPSPSPAPCPQVHSLRRVYSCHAKRFISTIFLDSIYMCVLIYNVHFSLSDLFNSVWQTLVSPTSLQLTQFCPFLYFVNVCLG